MLPSDPVIVNVPVDAPVDIAIVARVGPLMIVVTTEHPASPLRLNVVVPLDHDVPVPVRRSAMGWKSSMGWLTD